LCDGFEDGAVVNGFVGCFSPRKGCMVAYQYHFNFVVAQAQLFQVIDDLVACLVLVIAPDHVVVHRWGAGDINGFMIGMGGAIDGYTPLRLRPGGSVGGMGVTYPSYFGPLLVQHCMRFSIG